MLLNKQEKIIMNEFVKDKNNSIYGRAIAEKYNLNQKTVSNILKNFEKKDILKFKTEGKNKYYFLNINNPCLKEVLKLIEINKKIDFITKHVKFERLFKNLEQKTMGSLIVFGSYAKGIEKRNSDLDILVIGKIKEVREIEESFGLEINVIEMKKDKFNLNENFIKEVMENHIVLKGVEEFINLAW